MSTILKDTTLFIKFGPIEMCKNLNETCALLLLLKRSNTKAVYNQQKHSISNVAILFALVMDDLHKSKNSLCLNCYWYFYFFYEKLFLELRFKWPISGSSLLYLLDSDRYAVVQSIFQQLICRCFRLLSLCVVRELLRLNWTEYRLNI